MTSNDASFFTALSNCVPSETVLLGPRACDVTHQVIDATRAANKKFHSQCETALARFRLRGCEKDEFRAILGKTGATERLIASSCRNRQAATYILADLFRQHRLASGALPQRRHWHGSFLGPLVNEYEPKLDVDAYARAVDRLLRKAKLNAVFVIELQALTNYPQRGDGRSFVVNAHALCWTDDSALNIEAVAARLNKSKSIASPFGATLVKFTERTRAAGQIEYLAHYLLKAPFDGKYRTRSSLNRKRWVFERDSNVRPGLLLRLAEILSLFEFTDLIWGVNDGTEIRAAWKEGVSAWNDVQCSRGATPLERNFDTAELWERVRARGNGNKRCVPIQLFGPRPRPITNGRPRLLRSLRIRPSALPPQRKSCITVFTPGEITNLFR